MSKNIFHVKDYEMLAPRSYYAIGACLTIVGLFTMRSVIDLGLLPWMGPMFIVFGYGEHVRKQKGKSTFNRFHFLGFAFMFLGLIIGVIDGYVELHQLTGS